MKYSWLPLCLFVIACGRPEIQIDSSATLQSADGAPVGLLEVHRANSGNAFGVSLGETLSESRYCTGVLLQDGRILTSVGCLSDEHGPYDIRQLEFHLNWNGNGTTDHWRLERLESDASLAYLHPVQAGPDSQLARSRSPLLGDLPLDEKTTSVPALLVSVTSPDKNGKSKAVVSGVTVEYAPSGFSVTFTDTHVAIGTATQTASGTATSTSTSTSTDVSTEVAVFRVQKLKSETPGSPLLVKGKVVGISQNPGTRSGLDNVSWMDGRAQKK
jgi:hypothetical protein